MYHPSSDTIFRSHPHASQQSAEKPLSDHSHPSAVYGLLHLCLFLSVSQFLNLPYWYSHSYLFLPVPVPVYLYFSPPTRLMTGRMIPRITKTNTRIIATIYAPFFTSSDDVLSAVAFCAFVHAIPFYPSTPPAVFSITFLSIYYHNAFNSEIQSQFLN